LRRWAIARRSKSPEQGAPVRTEPRNLENNLKEDKVIKNELAGIVGKTLAGVIVKSCPTPPRSQLFLMFTDGTYYEIYAAEGLSTAGGVDRGGRKEVLDYMSGTTHVVFEAWA